MLWNILFFRCSRGTAELCLHIHTQYSSRERFMRLFNNAYSWYTHSHSHTIYFTQIRHRLRWRQRQKFLFFFSHLAKSNTRTLFRLVYSASLQGVNARLGIVPYSSSSDGHIRHEMIWLAHVHICKLLPNLLFAFGCVCLCLLWEYRASSSCSFIFHTICLCRQAINFLNSFCFILFFFSTFRSVMRVRHVCVCACKR